MKEGQPQLGRVSGAGAYDRWAFVVSWLLVVACSATVLLAGPLRSRGSAPVPDIVAEYVNSSGATSQPASQPAEAKPTLSAARKAFMRGYYKEATAQYEDLTKDPATGLEATIGLARCHFQAGEYEQAAAALDSASRAGRSSARWHAVRAEVLAEVGQYEQAIEEAGRALELDGRCCPVRLLRGRVLETVGRRQEALKDYEWFDRLVKHRLPTDAEDLTAAGKGFYRYSVLTGHSELTRRTRHVLSKMFQATYVVLDPDYWPARVAAGDLLREKYNLDEAAEDYQAALEINHQAADAHVGAGCIALEAWDFENVEAAVDNALASNPNHRGALQLLASCRIVERRYAEALTSCQQALAVNPNDVTALALAASAELAMDAADDAEAFIQRARAINPRSSELHRILADALTGLRRFPEAEKHYRLAIEYEPSAPAPRTELGMMYMLWRFEDKARPELDTAWNLDPFNARTKNTLDLLDRLTAFDTIETEHFIVRFDRGHDEILGPRFAEFLESIYAEICEAYDARLERKTIVEVFPQQREFGVRVTGKPWIQTVGACTGWVIAVSAPRRSTQLAGTYNFADVLRHEFTHTVTLAVTRNRIPHWFTEGLAVSQERRERPYDWAERLAERVRRGELFTLETIDWGFVRPRKAGDREMAYAQSEWICEYLVETYGPEIINNMLRGFCAAKSQDELLVESTGLTSDQFSEDFAAWASRQVAAWGFDLTPPEDVLELRALALDHPEDPEVQARLARAEFDAENWEQALAAARRSVELKPDDNRVGLEALVRALSVLVGQQADQESRQRFEGDLARYARQLIAFDPANRFALRPLAAIALAHERFDEAIDWLRALKAAQTGGPSDSFAPRHLGQILFERREWDLALPELLDAARTECHDENLYYRIASIYDLKQMPARATDWYEQTLYVNPLSERAHRGLAQLAMRMGRTEDALNRYRILCRIVPDNAEYYAECAFACHKIGDEDAARRLAARAVELDKESPAKVLLPAEK